MSERPTISTYEADEQGDEQLVHRQMNDDEYAQWQTDVAAAQARQEEQSHPLVAQVQAMSDEERAELRDLLVAPKGGGA